MPQKPVIAIVDDDESAREGTLDLLKSMGFAAEMFTGAVEFLHAERAQLTSCLIADVQMPGMTGLELHSRLVASGKNIPTILITAFPDERDRKRAMGAGVICYLTKPYREQDLLRCIRTALSAT
jgi:FixJ family two-component response regulator